MQLKKLLLAWGEFFNLLLLLLLFVSVKQEHRFLSPLNQFHIRYASLTHRLRFYLHSFCFHTSINNVNQHNNNRCFWEPAESLLKHPGVLATTVGYTGAPPNKPPPSYDTVCFGNDYVEAVRVVYDDTILDYTTLLDEFFDAQKPGLSRQYASIVFVDDTKSSEQQQAMEWKSTNVKTKVKRSDNLPYEIVEIEPLSKFYRAEEYHQRYWEKQRLRAAIAVVLLAGSSGAFDDLGGGAIGQFEVGGFAFDTICNGVFLVGAAWMILERLIARDVRELRSGDLIAEL
ncbi:hypothetical protein ACHAWT_004988 [Skeletonema menzelii]